MLALYWMIFGLSFLVTVLGFVVPSSFLEVLPLIVVPPVFPILAVMVLSIFLLFGLCIDTLNHMAQRNNQKSVHRLLAVLGQVAAQISLFCSFYMLFGVDKDGANIHWSSYESLYLSITSWTTLGYGDLKPLGPYRIVGAWQGLVGYLSVGLIVAVVLDLFKFR